MPKAFQTPRHWHLASLSSISQSEYPASKLIYSYSNVINGFCASLTDSELESMKASPGFLHSIHNSPVKFDTTHSTDFLGLTAVSSPAWESSNYGEGMIIGVVDTGAWPESDSYGDHGMGPAPARWKGQCHFNNGSLCNNKLVGARVFNNSLIVANINGHGTHTSSTAAGSFVDRASYFGYARGTAKGTSPKAHVAVYKALFGEYSSPCDAVAAIDQAVADGVDVLSISFGYDHIPLHEDPIAVATFAAVQRNVFVATSAGNAGTDLGALHNGIPWVLTVAAGTIDRRFRARLKIGNGFSVSGSSLYPGTHSTNESPVVFMGDCANATEELIRGKVLVCQGFNQLLSLNNSGAIGGVFVANVTESLLEELIQILLPAIFITTEDGKNVENYLRNHPAAKGSLEFGLTSFDLSPAPTLASYSSRGPSHSCPFVLKPDIVGPGSLILAAWPSNIKPKENGPSSLHTGFNLLSGTSMSCPHLAGVAALIKKAHPEWSPAAIRSAMMTTADSLDLSNQPIKDAGKSERTSTAFGIGAGHVNPNKALDPGLVYDAGAIDYVNLLCGMNFTAKQIRAITRSSTTNLCSAPTLDLNYPSFIALFSVNYSSSSSPNEVLEFTRTVTNVGKGTTSYRPTLTPLEGLSVKVVPNKLEFSSEGQKLQFKLTIENNHPVKKKPFVSSGYLRWTEDGGDHIVQSVIYQCRLIYPI
ncbi:unnamed protein product [Linum tenue]|uniref:Uncharacterized protein n=1 Tax=Linum tenue TaxID=586396 RepID=A0AAV0KQT4_9ROSI|nr:unnamed protein product [Linum tenue]